MKNIILIVVFLMVGCSIYAQQRPIIKVLKSEESVAVDTKKETNAVSTEEANKDAPPVLQKKVYVGSSHGQAPRPIRKILIPEEKESTETPK